MIFIFDMVENNCLEEIEILRMKMEIRKYPVVEIFQSLFTFLLSTELQKKLSEAL